MKLAKRQALTGWALVLPLLMGCVLFYAVPFCMVAWFSGVNGSGYSREFAGFSNYKELLRNEIFRMAAGNTAAFLILGIGLNLLIAYGIALLIKKQMAGSRLLQSVVMLPYVMPVVGTVLMADIVFTETGLANALLQRLGLPVADWLQSEMAFVMVLFLYLWKNTGYSVLLFLSGLATIPPEQYDAAELDGAKPRQKFCHITAPQMWYSVFFAGVFSLLNAFKSFREILLIGGSHPHHSIYMLQHFINNSYAKMGYSKMAGASIMLVALLCILFGICYRLVLRKEAYKE